MNQNSNMMSHQAQNLDDADKSSILGALTLVHNLLKSNAVLQLQYILFTPLPPGFRDLMINMRHLVFMHAKYGYNLSSTDDVNTTNDIRNVSDLIIFVRNAVCHPELQDRQLRAFAKGQMSLLDSKTKVSEVINPYKDDTCWVFGNQRIFYRRHIIPAFQAMHHDLMPRLILR